MILRKLLSLILPCKPYARAIGVKFGKHCLISTKNWSTEPYLISIGDHVQITKGASIHTHGSANVLRRENPEFDIFGKVVICDWAYIGSYAQIMPGVTIGEGAIVAAGSIVTKSVPPGVLVGGNPAKIICTIEEYKERNLKYDRKSKKLSFRAKKELLESLPNDCFVHKDFLK